MSLVTYVSNHLVCLNPDCFLQSTENLPSDLPPSKKPMDRIKSFVWKSKTILKLFFFLYLLNLGEICRLWFVHLTFKPFFFIFLFIFTYFYNPQNAFLYVIKFCIAQAYLFCLFYSQYRNIYLVFFPNCIFICVNTEISYSHCVN